ncbi:MAG: GNAT family N-acetyltransferase [Rhodobacteraceae bacterium]|nr:GNAT family N-acetyltransferase [Paracoccaceae bacterium]
MSEPMHHPIRPAVKADQPALVDLWYQGWTEAHAAYVSAELTAMRTRDSFLIRLQDMLATTSTLGDKGEPLGLCAVKGDEIYQMYVGPQARGTGAASRLMADGLARIAAAGHNEARLDVIPQNARAIAFYEKAGWKQSGIETVMVDTLGAPFPLECLVMFKPL